MRGEILHYDVEQGIGFVSADDGNRYMFSRNDLQQSQRVGKGTRIDFRPEGQNARDVFIVDPRGPSVPSIAAVPAAAAPAESFGREAQAPALGLWGYFMHCCTTAYADFRARARRKEYWSFVLFYVIAMIAVSLLGVTIDEGLGNFEGGRSPVATLVLVGIAVLFFLVPMLAVTVRRFHDVGLSGWLYLLFFVLSFVYIGGIIIFVLTLLPSQKHDNKWGPVPPGVAVR